MFESSSLSENKIHKPLECDTCNEENQQNIINQNFLSGMYSHSDDSVLDRKEEGITTKQTLFFEAGKIYFCDLPNNKRETIETYFSIEERQHIIR